MNEAEIRADERLKVYEEIIGVCEEQKKKLMNLSIPLRDRPIRVLNEIIGHCCSSETSDESIGG